MATPITRELARTLAPPRAKDAHKGSFGHVLIVAGAPGYTGAGCMAAEAAARAGAGLVTLACPASLNPIFEVKLTEVMTLPVAESSDHTFSPDAVERVAEAISTRSAVGLGPGLGQHPDTRAFVHALVPRATKPIVIDADGLNALAASQRALLPLSAPCVLTPHPGEMSRLTGLATREIQTDRVQTAVQWAARWGSVVVLKGAATIVAAPDGRAWVNTTGNQGLASGGTGDVLTGLIAGLLAQGLAAPDAACLAVYLHGWAGDAVAAQGSPRALIAGDLLPALAPAWRALLGPEVEEPA